MAQTTLSKLKFRIISVSGEELDYPATELLTQSPSSKGWQSPKYCEYPQELALQFLNPVRLRQVQFLSHQCKIASKVELYVYMPDGNIPLNNREIRYKKLGYLSLDSNEQSGYQARELKSVYIEAPCQYLKLVFQKCHLNKYNLFNQIGLIALSVFGEPLNMPGGQSQQKAKEFFNEIQFETQFDPTTLDRMRTLEEAKERAIKNEDFMEAKRIKEAIDRLKQIGVQLRQLEERKQVAIQNEDYDSANIIKKEIEKLRNAVAPESLMRYEQPQQQFAPMQFNPPPTAGQQYPYNQPVNPQSKPSRQADDMQFNDYPPPPPQQDQYPYEEEHKVEPDPFNSKSRMTRKDQLLAHDEQVIPAMMARSGKAQDEYGDQNPNSNLKIDNLVGDNYKKAETLIPILTEEFCKMIFSKSWNTKEEGLLWLETQIARPKDVNAQDVSVFFIACMGAVSFTINDRVAAVYGKAISVLQALLAKHQKLKVAKRGDFNEYTDTIIQGLMEKLGDTNPRIKEQAEQSFRMLGDHPSIGPLLCVNHLIKGISLKPKLDASVKHLNGRLFILQEFVRSYEINNASMPYQPIVDFTIKQLEHQNEGIRTAAIFVLVEIYKFQGDRLRHSLANVRPAQMEILEKFFSEINGGGNVEKMMEEQKMVVSTHIEHQGQNQNQNPKAPAKKPPAQTKVNSQPQKQDLVDPSSICEFCEKVNKEFKDSNKLDIHLWKECPMLTTCSQCAQVVEISSYTQHLLEECDQHRSYKKCPRCRMAIHVSNYDVHVQEMKCLPAKPPNQSSRCPLCHEEIKPGPQGWRIHLVQQGCQNNERTAG